MIVNLAPNHVKSSRIRSQVTTPPHKGLILMRFKKYQIIFLFFISFHSYADFKDGVQCAKLADWDCAKNEWLPLAEKGSSRVQYNLAKVYEEGYGDFSEALKWYKKAAVNGMTRAHFNLGNMYQAGRGIEQSYVEAAKWYQKGSDLGHAEAL